MTQPPPGSLENYSGKIKPTVKQIYNHRCYDCEKTFLSDNKIADESADLIKIILF